MDLVLLILVNWFRIWGSDMKALVQILPGRLQSYVTLAGHSAPPVFKRTHAPVLLLTGAFSFLPRPPGCLGPVIQAPPHIRQDLRGSEHFKTGVQDGIYTDC